jgi:FAD/FMN-containing dehydrogenase
MRRDIGSWNRVPAVVHARAYALSDRSQPLPKLGQGETAIAFGNGRSYGDVCLNPGQSIFFTRGLDRFIAFDRATGRLVCEAGVLIAEIVDLAAPMGWFPAVTPGTRFATVGGAIANDVHGKNHHVAGAFGHHVRSLELQRSDGSRLHCSPADNADFFAATIGGLGLTGLIVWAELQLQPIANPFMISQARKFASLDEFWALNQEDELTWPYTVSWIDCTAKRGRGVLLAGAHAPAQALLPSFRERTLTFPIDPPISLVNPWSLKAFNIAFYRRPLPKRRTLTHFAPYFYPLDAIREWNRMYGRRGFFQYQCVLPPDVSRQGLGRMLNEISAAGTGSFLAVLKTFGALPSLGMLSFPRPGATLALDFPNKGETTAKLLARLDGVVSEAGGALYPAKDARMSGEMFRRGFPRWSEFAKFVDPKFSSGFWRRATQQG